MRMHTNIAEFCGRRLLKQYNGAGTAIDKVSGTKAVGITAPTSLGGQEIAMGQAGKNGIVSFIVSDVVNQAFTLWVYSSSLAKILADSKLGWVYNGSNVAEYQKTCDGRAKISFYVSEGEEFFIQAVTSPCTEVLVSGSESDNNKNTNRTGVTTR